MEGRSPFINLKKLGIIGGVMKPASLGFAIHTGAELFNSGITAEFIDPLTGVAGFTGIESILLSNRTIQKELRVAEHSGYRDDFSESILSILAENSDWTAESAKRTAAVNRIPATVEEMLSECGMTVVCIENAIGAAQGNFSHTLPKDFRSTLLNANMQSILELGKEFGRSGYSGYTIIITNPIDEQTRNFHEAYVSAGGSEEGASRIFGFNYLDKRRADFIFREFIGQRLKSKGLLKDVPSESVGVDIALWGTHDIRSFIVPSRSYVSIKGSSSKTLVDLMEDNLISPEEVEQLRLKTAARAWHHIFHTGTSSQNTAAAWWDFYGRLVSGEESCTLSQPYHCDGMNSPFTFVGLPVTFDKGTIISLSKDSLESLRPEEKSLVDSLALQLDGDLKQRSDRSQQLSKSYPGTKFSEVPLSRKELVIPAKQDGYSNEKIHFYEVHEGVAYEVRAPYRIDGAGKRVQRVFVKRRGNNDSVIVSLTHGRTASLEEINPVSQESLRFETGLEGFITGLDYAGQRNILFSIPHKQSKDAGIYVLNVLNKRVAKLKAGGANFLGAVKVVGSDVYYAEADSIVRAELEGSFSRGFSFRDTVRINHGFNGNIRDFIVEPKDDSVTIYAALTPHKQRGKRRGASIVKKTVLTEQGIDTEDFLLEGRKNRRQTYKFRLLETGYMGRSPVLFAATLNSVYRKDLSGGDVVNIFDAPTGYDIYSIKSGGFDELFVLLTDNGSKKSVRNRVYLIGGHNKSELGDGLDKTELNIDYLNNAKKVCADMALIKTV